MQVSGQMQTGIVQVRTTNGRGQTPEEISEEAVDRILYVGENVHPVIRDQAKAFKDQIRLIMIHYMKQAIKSDRTTLAARFKSAGHGELVKLLEN